LPIVRMMCVIFIEFWRGVPLITVLFFATYMLPLFLPGNWRFDPLARVLVGVVLFAGAYQAEVVRRGLQAMPRGPYEGAMGVGLRAGLLGDVVFLGPAAGAQIRHPRHGQFVYRAVQGYDAGADRLDLRSPRTAARGFRRSQLGDAGYAVHGLCLCGHLLFPDF